MSLPLGDDFQPGRWDVICGRGRHSYTHVGNRRFRIVVANNFRRYVEATSLREKMDLIEEIHNIISYSDGMNMNVRGGLFVKRHRDGTWYQLNNREAKKKISHTFRDYMRGPLRRNAGRNCTLEETEIAIREAEEEIIRSCGLMGSTNGNDAR